MPRSWRANPIPLLSGVGIDVSGSGVQVSDGAQLALQLGAFDATPLAQYRGWTGLVTVPQQGVGEYGAWRLTARAPILVNCVQPLTSDNQFARLATMSLSTNAAPVAPTTNLRALSLLETGADDSTISGDTWNIADFPIGGSKGGLSGATLAPFVLDVGQFLSVQYVQAANTAFTCWVDFREHPLTQ